MRPDDLALLHSVSDPALHPDGDRVVVAVSRPDTDEDRYERHLLLVHLDGSTRRLTHGPGDTAPRWSPSGDRLAFLRSAGPKDPAQLAVLPADGGEADVLTDLPLGAAAPAWSPDGRFVVVVGAVRRDDVADLDADERARRPRRITDRGFRADQGGWVHDRSKHLWLVDTTGRDEPRRLTEGDRDHVEPCFTADGAAVLCTAARQDSFETDAAAGVWRVPLDGGEQTEVAAPGWWSAPVPDGAGGVLTTGLPDPFAWPAAPRVHRHAGGAVVDLAPDLDRDLAGRPDRGVQVLADGSVLATAEDRGGVHLVRLADGAAEVLVGGAQVVTGYDASPDGALVAYTASHPTDPGELWVLQDGEPRVLTSLNEELRARLLPVEHVTFERDGVELDAWVVLPEGDATAVPLLLNIHGGPTAQYPHAFFDEFQVEAGAGYAVVGINPRGSSGRGRDFARAVVGAWPDEDSVDTLDLEAVVDVVLERFGRVSRERLGIMGGSYGGYATARILARTDRFRSAIVERGLLNWVSFGGTSDIGAYFDRMFVGTDLPSGADAQWQASPVRTADRITTPTLVLHSLEDHRCPPEQAYQLFSILRRNGVESELLLFPDEGHELSRSGSPKHRVERFEAVLDWHGRHLGMERPAGG